MWLGAVYIVLVSLTLYYALDHPITIHDPPTKDEINTVNTFFHLAFWNVFHDVVRCFMFPLILVSFLLSPILTPSDGIEELKISSPELTAPAVKKENGVEDEESSRNSRGEDKEPPEICNKVPSGIQASRPRRRNVQGFTHTKSAGNSPVFPLRVFPALSKEHERLSVETPDSGRSSPWSSSKPDVHLDLEDTSLSMSDRWLYWMLSIGITTLWPSGYAGDWQLSPDRLGMLALALMMFARCVPGCVVYIIQVFGETMPADRSWFLLCRIIFQLWFVCVGLVVGFKYFQAQSCKRTGHHPDNSALLWHKLRSVGSNLTAGPPLQTWAKGALVLLLIMCAVEVKSRKVLEEVYGIQDMESVSLRGKRQNFRTFVTGLWRDTLYVPVEVVSNCYNMFVEASVGWPTVFSCIGLAAIVGVWLVKKYRRTWLSVIHGKFVLRFCDALFSYFVLVTVRRFTSSLLSLVICLDISVLELEIKRFQKHDVLLGQSRANRIAEYVRLGEEVKKLNRELRLAIHFVVIDKFFYLMLDTCGYSGEQYCPEWRCAASATDCFGPFSREYTWVTLAYLGRHLVTAGLVSLTLWRMSCLNYRYHDGMLDSIFEARLQMLKIDNKDETPNSTALGHYEVVAWKDLITSYRRQHMIGVKLFGFVVGRLQMIGWLGAWLVSVYAELARQDFIQVPLLNLFLGLRAF